MYGSVKNKEFAVREKPSLLMAVDNTSSQKFNIGDNGLPMSDVTAALKAQSIEQMKALQEQITTASKMPNLNDGLTSEQIIDNTVSIRNQTHAEKLRIQEWQFVNSEQYKELTKVPEPAPVEEKSVDPVTTT